MSRWHPANNRSVGEARNDRNGYTLLELVIVMAILASIMAISWPRVSPLLRRSLHRDAALQLKSDLAEARQRAVHEGQVWGFRVFPGTGRYLIGPAGGHFDEPLSEMEARSAVKGTKIESVGSADQLATSAKANSIEGLFIDGELPDGVVFARHPYPRGGDKHGQIDGETDSVFVDPTKEPDVAEKGMSISNARPVAEFFPDGRTTEATIDLMRQETLERIPVRLRGLTGSVSIGEVVSFRESQRNVVNDLPGSHTAPAAQSPGAAGL